MGWVVSHGMNHRTSHGMPHGMGCVLWDAPVVDNPYGIFHAMGRPMGRIMRR